MLGLLEEPAVASQVAISMRVAVRHRRRRAHDSSAVGSSSAVCPAPFCWHGGGNRRSSAQLASVQHECYNGSGSDPFAAHHPLPVRPETRDSIRARSARRPPSAPRLTTTSRSTGNRSRPRADNRAHPAEPAACGASSPPRCARAASCPTRRTGSSSRRVSRKFTAISGSSSRVAVIASMGQSQPQVWRRSQSLSTAFSVRRMVSRSAPQPGSRP